MVINLKVVCGLGIFIEKIKNPQIAKETKMEEFLIILRRDLCENTFENFSDIKEISLVLPNDAEELDWTAENDIKEMCEGSWRWQKNNPNGCEGEE